MAVTWRKLAAEDDVLLITGATTGATVQAQTFTNGVIDSSLTASRLLASNGSKQLASVANLADWIAGTANQVTVTNDGDGSVTLSLPQDIHTAATPTFAGVVAAYLRPAVDSTTALQLQTAGGTPVVTVDTTNSRLVVGTTTPIGDSHEFGTGIYTARYAATANGTFIRMYRGRGTAASPSKLVRNDIIAELRAVGYVRNSGDTADANTNLAQIFWRAYSVDGSGKADSSIEFTTSKGSATPTTALNIYPNRTVTINAGVADSSAIAVFALGNGTAPTASGTDATQLYSADQGGTAGNAGLHVRSETGAIHSFGSYASVPGLIVNDDGASEAAADLRAESDTEANMLWLDASADLLYLGGSTNGVQIAKGGDLTLLGTAKYERHIQIPVTHVGNPANAPTPIDVFTAGGDQYGTTGAKYGFCQWELPDDWDGGDIYFEIDWLPDSGAISGTDAVRWTVEYRCIAEGELINKDTSVTLDNGVGGDTADYSQYQTKHTRFTLTYNNADQPLTAQDHIYFKVSRDTSVANDFGGSVVVTAYEIIYTSKSFPTN